MLLFFAVAIVCGTIPLQVPLGRKAVRIRLSTFCWPGATLLFEWITLVNSEIVSDAVKGFPGHARFAPLATDPFATGAIWYMHASLHRRLSVGTSLMSRLMSVSAFRFWSYSVFLCPQRSALYTACHSPSSLRLTELPQTLVLSRDFCARSAFLSTRDATVSTLLVMRQSYEGSFSREQRLSQMESRSAVSERSLRAVQSASTLYLAWRMKHSSSVHLPAMQ